MALPETWISRIEPEAISETRAARVNGMGAPWRARKSLESRKNGRCARSGGEYIERVDVRQNGIRRDELFLRCLAHALGHGFPVGAGTQALHDVHLASVFANENARLAFFNAL